MQIYKNAKLFFETYKLRKQKFVSLQHYRPHRRSWLRLYAIKLSMGIYIITGGAIKLTRTMQEREHTLQELEKMEKVRNFLIREHVFDEDSFTDYQQEVEL